MKFAAAVVHDAHVVPFDAKMVAVPAAADV